MADEMLGPILLSIHNLTYYQRLLAEARAAIGEGRFDALRNRIGGSETSSCGGPPA
jgi:queuine tRNA-ribosyltransferase